MTDLDAVDPLDRRAHAAAAGLRAAVAGLPVPVLDPDVVRIALAPRPPDRRRSILLAAAAVLLVVAAVVAVARLGSDEDDPPTDVVPGDVRRFVLSDRSGLRLGMLFDRAESDPGPRSSLSIGPTAYYGTEPDAPALGVRAVVDAGGVTAGPDPASMPSLDVGGRQAWRGEGAGPGDDVSVLVGDALVTVVATGADEEQILAAAGAVVVDGDGRASLPAASLPAGWEHLGTVLGDAGNPEAAILVAEGAAPVSWAATYWDDEGREVAVTVAPGRSVRDRVPELVTDDVDQVDVRGHEALVARTDGDVVEDLQTVSVTWEEQPGEIVQVIGSAELGVETVVDLARDVVAIAPGATADLRRQMFEGEISAPGTDLVGRGTLSSGVEWALIESSDDDYLELVTKPPASRRWAVSSGTSGGSDAASAASPFNGSSVNPTGTDVWVAYGGLDPEVTDVEVRLDGSDQVVPVTLAIGAGHRGWVAEWPGPRDREVPPGVAIARALDGTELGRLEIPGPSG